jgi:hypothetical protein
LADLHTNYVDVKMRISVRDSPLIGGPGRNLLIAGGGTAHLVGGSKTRTS